MIIRKSGLNRCLMILSCAGILLFLHACGKQTSDEKGDSAVAQVDLSGVYVGRLGAYELMAVFRIEAADEELAGSYQYTRHGKPLTLKGTWDKASSLEQMTESWNGRVTGLFRFGLNDEGKLDGQWKSPDDSTLHHFTLAKLEGGSA